MGRRYYAGDPDKQPKDCGRRHPQPLCMCVLCEIAARFASIAKLQRHLELLRAIREVDDPSAARGAVPFGSNVKANREPKP